jgi:hypothetical protein
LEKDRLVSEQVYYPAYCRDRSLAIGQGIESRHFFIFPKHHQHHQQINKNIISKQDVSPSLGVTSSL